MPCVSSSRSWWCATTKGTWAA